MNKFLFLILLFCCTAAFGQSRVNAVFELDSLPSNVTGEWRFHAGDNQAWADTAFDDHTWNYIDATKEQHFLPQVTNAKIGWFRLTIRVAPAMRGKTVALAIYQNGAAQIYFNGDLMRSMGTVSADYGKEQTRVNVDEPLTLHLSASPCQFIAIRYSFNNSNLVIGYGHPVIVAGFSQVESAWDDFYYLLVDRYTIYSWVGGALMLLAILQLAIYFFNRERKVNLYLSIYAFLLMCTLIGGLLLPMLQSANWSAALRLLFNIAAPIAIFFLVVMTCSFFGYNRDRWLYILALLCIPVIIASFIADNSRNQYLLVIYNILCYFKIIQVSVQSLRQKKTGAALYLCGIGISLIIFTLFSSNTALGVWQPHLLIHFEVALAFLAPAITLSILLAHEFVANLISLRLKLAEVESLSAQNLQQEIEKQQIISKQNEELEKKVTERTAELNHSLTELKNTQTQLIQSEKMASLGELTAGIAHEIQNPLNFVNNFSEVNKEMVEELEEELKKGNIEEALAIAADIKGNEEKINHHGKRADFIVKGMLLHSRNTTGEKEPTDINAMANEFLKLSYHGLRAKDKNFNAELVTNFDKDLPKIIVAHQDIGRVLLNLFNNAFYAVNQKQKMVGADYKPEVTVSTATEKNNLVIKVKDNGNGIPAAIKDKIMQPFFTTKPTGEGTGLGLSLSYDIVAKGHGGSLSVDTKEGGGSEFMVSLPIDQA